jgi:hypothetical protein
MAAQVTEQLRVWIPTEPFGLDPTRHGRPLVTADWVGSDKQPGTWLHEISSHPSKPDDRRDSLAQLLICRTPWLGIRLLQAA